MKKFIYDEKVEEYAKRARTAQTNEELAEVCTAMNIADIIYLGQMDLWLAKCALSAVYRMLKKFPYMRDYLNYFGTFNGFLNNRDKLVKNACKIKYLYMKDSLTEGINDLMPTCLESFRNDAIAMYCYFGEKDLYISGIMVNGKSMNQRTVLNQIINDERVGFHPIGCNSIKSVIEHELGHMFDYALGISASDEFYRIMLRYNYNYLYKNLSEYSVYNNSIDYKEVIAEAYSEYCNNPTPREVAQKIGTLIEQKYREKYYGQQS